MASPPIQTVSLSQPGSEALFPELNLTDKGGVRAHMTKGPFCGLTDDKGDTFVRSLA
jgi:hypothetical protein